MSDNRNLILAIVLSAAVLFGWQYFVAMPQMKADQARHAQIAKQEKAAIAAPVAGALSGHLPRNQALELGGKRVPIDTPAVDGSLRLKGARFDDLRLKGYRETVDPKSPEIILLAPEKTDFPYYAEFGFVGAPGAKIPVPDDNTLWKLKEGTVLSPSSPVTLEWDNGHGQIFDRKIAVDDKFMFTVTDSVTNKSASRAVLYPYAKVARVGAPKALGGWTLHEGFVGVAGETLKDPAYTDFKEEGTPPQTFSATQGWVGITDKYWMATVVPPQNQNFDATYSASTVAGAKAYQADYRLPALNVAPGATVGVTQRLFAGAKVFDALRTYEHKLGISRFDLAIDWGWFIIITQPLFWLVDQFYHFLGNFGLAILLLTVVVKALFFPIANAQYKSMSKMKKVQPEMEKLKQRFADDPVKQQQALMELYKREKVNPVTGCLPMLLIIPVFFSLYKVLYVTIEMRHAPFYGWIHDLSAPDPTSILNLFGLLPYHIPAFVPAFLSIGIWPILMGMTQWVQTKLNPAPADPVQAKMFAFMPLIFTFMFATLPAGLVIYYTWNNLLSVAQQWLMMHRQGVPVHLFESMKTRFAPKPELKSIEAPKK